MELTLLRAEHRAVTLIDAFAHVRKNHNTAHIWVFVLGLVAAHVLLALPRTDFAAVLITGSVVAAAVVAHMLAKSLITALDAQMRAEVHSHKPAMFTMLICTVTAWLGYALGAAAVLADTVVAGLLGAADTLVIAVVLVTVFIKNMDRDMERTRRASVLDDYSLSEYLRASAK